jgi:putative membrane protein
MKRLLHFLLWILRVVVFILLFSLALKNSGPVELRFYFDQVWQAPVSVVLLVTFALGILVGLTVSVGRLFQRKAP